MFLVVPRTSLFSARKELVQEYGARPLAPLRWADAALAAAATQHAEASKEAGSWGGWHGG